MLDVFLCDIPALVAEHTALEKEFVSYLPMQCLVRYDAASLDPPSPMGSEEKAARGRSNGGLETISIESCIQRKGGR